MEFPHTCGVDPYYDAVRRLQSYEFPHTCGVDPLSGIAARYGTTSFPTLVGLILIIV